MKNNRRNFYGYDCPICGEPIKNGQATDHSEDGLCHATCIVLDEEDARYADNGEDAR